MVAAQNKAEAELQLEKQVETTSYDSRILLWSTTINPNKENMIM